jgi:hypothetical protein
MRLENETKINGGEKYLVLTFGLTSFLILLIVAGTFWLAHFLIRRQSELNELIRAAASY